MTSTFARKVQCRPIFILLIICLFTQKILLGNADSFEAVLTIRMEQTSFNFDQYFITTDTYQSFQNYFFNNTISSIQLHYTFDTNGTYRHINEIGFLYGESQYNGTFYSCLNVLNTSTIQCHKISATIDSLSEKCENGTGIKWFNKEEKLSSSYFMNYTITNNTRVTVVCYTLIDTVELTSTSTLRVSSSTITTTTTGKSPPSVKTTSDDSSTLSSGVIAGVSIGIITVIIAIVVFVLVLKMRKHIKVAEETDRCHVQSANTRNAYNQQAIDKIGENSNYNLKYTSSKHTDDFHMEVSKDRSQVNNGYTEKEPDYVSIDKDDSIPKDTRLSTIDVSKDVYTYIKETDENGQAGTFDGYSTLRQTIAGFDESIERPQGKNYTGVPNYNNVDVVKAEDKEQAGRKKDVYSKLGEQTRTSQSDYRECKEDFQNGINDNDNKNKDKEKDGRKDIYSKLREKNVHFQNTYGIIAEKEENVLEFEFSNTYFELEKENPNV